jgi:hypothetical protein
MWRLWNRRRPKLYIFFFCFLMTFSLKIFFFVFLTINYRSLLYIRTHNPLTFFPPSPECFNVLLYIFRRRMLLLLQSSRRI